MRLVRNGEEREFKRAVDPTGAEPAFYRVTTAGEYAASPVWETPIPLSERPKPPILDWPHVPLTADGRFRFRIEAARKELADLYYFATGLYLVSDRLLNLLKEHDPAAVEDAVACVQLRAGDVATNYKVAMPHRVIDAVDIRKTDVTIARSESPKGSGRYVTHVRYDSGFVIDADLDRSVVAFSEKYQADWLWREDLVHSAVGAGVRGLRAVFCSDALRRPEIRTCQE